MLLLLVVVALLLVTVILLLKAYYAELQQQLELHLKPAVCRYYDKLLPSFEQRWPVPQKHYQDQNLQSLQNVQLSNSKSDDDEESGFSPLNTSLMHVCWYDPAWHLMGILLYVIDLIYCDAYLAAWHVYHDRYIWAFLIMVFVPLPIFAPKWIHQGMQQIILPRLQRSKQPLHWLKLWHQIGRHNLPLFRRTSVPWNKDAALTLWQGLKSQNYPSVMQLTGAKAEIMATAKTELALTDYLEARLETYPQLCVKCAFLLYTFHSYSDIYSIVSVVSPIVSFLLLSYTLWTNFEYIFESRPNRSTPTDIRPPWMKIVSGLQMLSRFLSSMLTTLLMIYAFKHVNENGLDGAFTFTNIVGVLFVISVVRNHFITLFHPRGFSFRTRNYAMSVKSYVINVLIPRACMDCCTVVYFAYVADFFFDQVTSFLFFACLGCHCCYNGLVLAGYLFTTGGGGGSDYDDVASEGESAEGNKFIVQVSSDGNVKVDCCQMIDEI